MTQTLLFSILLLTAQFAHSQITLNPPTKKTEAEVIAQGRYIFNLSGCVHCHTSDKKKPLAGGYELKSAFGTFYPPNITPDKKTGIGLWTEAQFIKALRQGISPKGEFYYPSFPYTNYTKVTDEDLLAMRKYLMTLPAIEQPNKTHMLKFPYNKRALLGFWRALFFRRYAVSENDYLQIQGIYKLQPNKSTSWNRGAYLVEGAMHCAQCHTPRNKLGGLITKKWMAGTSIFGSQTSAPNLTPDAETGLKLWKKEDWKNLLVDGVTADGDIISGEMAKIIRVGTSKLSDADLEAVITYFQELPAVKNAVSNP